MRHHLTILVTVALAAAPAAAQQYTIREVRFGYGRITELTPAPVKPPVNPTVPAAKLEKRKQEPLPALKAPAQPRAEQAKDDVNEAAREAEERLAEAIRNLNPGYILRGAKGRGAATDDSVFPDQPLAPRRPMLVPRKP